MVDTVSQSAAIAISTSLSAAIALGEKVAVGIVMPSGWDAANLTFQGSADGGATFNNVYDSSGNELTVTAAASRYIYLDPSAFVGLNQIKVRSGTNGTPVNQTAARALTIVTR
ncbi:hypothetical protein [Bradyrhizobium sp. BR 10261]|uniref:hypothetical protein n=1 Tax=Bradyrhizobium sp. BR 10261 TaxID=2749992 RepID=UPI001C651C13|nr:hypothetical protein [Bradyrhizobium sp. BR 10261]MBW7967570.1 hypothetical protein [Bradyrhizobium sp. BR 10261]